VKISDAVEKYEDGKILYVVKEIDIRWDTMRFLNTTITPAKYVVDSEGATLWAPVKHLRKIDSPKGTGLYSDKLSSTDTQYRCFQTPKEAEVWKVIELQNLETKVDEHLEEMKKKTKNKIKKLKQKEQFDDYLEKYPEEFLKVMR
jgi:hypothetical protein